MARLVGNMHEALREDVVREYARTVPNQMRPGRCSNERCRVGIARPQGGAVNGFPCPLCGGRCIQSTWDSKEIRQGYVVLSRAESLALARGEKIEVERPLTAALAARMDIHEIYDRIPVAPVGELGILNAEVQRRLA